MKKNIVIFQSEGGSDKWINGHRKDSLPICEELKKLGFNCEILFFRPEWAFELFEYCKERFDGYISRINPGNLENGEKIYFDFLDSLIDYGLVPMSSPKEMISYGSKEILVKLISTGLIPEDTYAYYNYETFSKNFPKTLKTGDRVLKQNRGSTGSGVFKVSNVDERDFTDLSELPYDTKIKIIEAVDNHIEYKTLGDFLKSFKEYLEKEDGVIVGMKYFPRIKEGEIRVLFVGEKAIFVVHKKPVQKEDSFSATLFSGAKYNYYKPEDYKELVDFFSSKLPEIQEKLGNKNLPLIWTADFILDFDENGKDKYILGEINCSCVGFTNQLDIGIQEKIAKEVVKRIEKKFNS